ncbi:MAG TPA: ribosome maturation factor RimP [Firmicutes bacterium]|mgnify:FL=1|nr:ribosome maturation factor RimP [Bacillota bacterium]
MPKEKKKNTVAICEELAAPVAREMGLELWDVRFEKEGSGWYLRYFLDKEGGVTIDDCERFSRAVDPLLDQADPIEQSYCLEVSSPGVERELVKPAHFARYLGSPVRLRLIRPVDGVREFEGILTGYENDTVTLDLGEEMEMQAARSETAYVRLIDDYSYGGEEQ